MRKLQRGFTLIEVVVAFVLLALMLRRELPLRGARLAEALRGEGEQLTGKLRLGTTPSFNTRMVPSCVATYLHHYPGIQVTVEELSAGMIAKRLGSGHLDLAVSSRPPPGRQAMLRRLRNAAHPRGIQ